ncbi:MAG: hypothetical protein B7X30_14970 [Thiomonas sp. 13-64-67]|nr:MAG: hypothetical protein B7X30_14970 [Thiomonas sp. 13-64-67]
MRLRERHVNTDQGSQFTAQDFVDAVQNSGAQLSMDGRGAWRDNVFVERVWCSVKYERVYLRAYASVREARADIGQYIDWYNRDRPHSSQDGNTPEQAYLACLSCRRLPKMIPRCAPSCPPRRPFVASEARRRGQLCTVSTHQASTYLSGKSVLTNRATSLSTGLLPTAGIENAGALRRNPFDGPSQQCPAKPFPQSVFQATAPWRVARDPDHTPRSIVRPWGA